MICACFHRSTMQRFRAWREEVKKKDAEQAAAAAAAAAAAPPKPARSRASSRATEPAPTVATSTVRKQSNGQQYAKMESSQVRASERAGGPARGRHSGPLEWFTVAGRSEIRATNEENESVISLDLTSLYLLAFR